TTTYAAPDFSANANNDYSTYSLPIAATGAGHINPATLTYVADAKSRNYGASDPAFTGTVTGFVLSQTQATATTGTLLFSTTATSTSNVGSYPINGSGLTANNGNYTFVQAIANATALTINPATLTYVADAKSRNYGASDPAFRNRE